MIYRALFRRAIRQMCRYRLRSVLLATCSALGVAGVVASIDYASGGRQQVLDQIRRMGSNTIIITARQDRAIAGRARTGSIVTTLRDGDYVTLRREVAAQVRSSGLVTAALRLKVGDLSKVTPVVGCEPSYFITKSWPLEQGANFDQTDLRRAARVALLGRTVALDLYGPESPIGRRLFINRIPFEVVGLLGERGQGLDVTNEDAQVYVPVTTAMHRLANIDYYNALIFEIGAWSDMDRSAKLMTDVLRVRHRSSTSRPDDFQVQSQKELVETQLAASERLAFFVRWIGASGLLVSGLGVLAMAWITVRDRTVEIGTRRAVGATARQIFAQFAFEASVLAAIGSLAGLALGWAATFAIARRTHLPFVFDSATGTMAVLSSLCLNLVFSAGPALRAARLDPILALKHE